MATATVTPEGLIDIPMDILERLQLHAGDKLEIEIENEHVLKIFVKSRKISEIAGMLQPYIQEPLTLEEIDARVENGFCRGDL